MAKAQRFDAAEYLDDPQAIADYLTEAFETGDVEFVAQAIGTVARAEGMMEDDMTTQYVVIAHATDEDWAYGPFESYDNAHAFATEYGSKTAIEYQVAELLPLKWATSKDGDWATDEIIATGGVRG